MAWLEMFHGEKRTNRQAPAESSTGDLIFALDIGTTAIRLTAGQVSADGTVKIMGYKERPSAGVSQGSVVNILALSQALAELTQQFESEFGFILNNCVIAAPGYFISSDNVSGTATVQNGTVDEVDRRHAIESANAGIKTFNETDFDTIHMIVQNYETETSNEIVNPIGQYAKRLNVNVHVVGLKRSHENNMLNVLKSLRSDLIGSSFVYSGIAAADAVLTESQKELGVCLIDIGGGSTNAVVYENRKLVMSFGLPRGGDAITRAIAKHFGISSLNAERLKRQYGRANPMTLPEDQVGSVIRVETGDSDIEVRFEELAQVINVQLQDIFRMVKDEIYRRIRDQLYLSAGFVVTGGVAMTQDITRLFVQQDDQVVKVTIGVPRGIEATSERDKALFTYPDKAVTVGLLRTGYRAVRENEVQKVAEEEQSGGVIGGLRKIWHWFKTEMN